MPKTTTKLPTPDIESFSTFLTQNGGDESNLTHELLRELINEVKGLRTDMQKQDPLFKHVLSQLSKEPK